MIRAIFAAALMAGCAAGAPLGEVEMLDAKTFHVGPHHTVWTTDGELETFAHDAAARIEAASGLRVRVTGTPGATTELRWMTAEELPSWLGLQYRAHGEDFISINPVGAAKNFGQVVLHEMLHMLGVDHVPDFQGVMAKSVGKATPWITSVDLEALCAENAKCTTFMPEPAPAGPIIPSEVQ